MHVEHHRWWSRRLNRDMNLNVYGHWGKPFIVFPARAAAGSISKAWG